ncbi:MAG: efflux RND transporter permease subunit [Limisphaerales bacterium]
MLVDPQRLRAAGVTLDAVTRAAGDAAVVSAGGFIDTPNRRFSVTQLGLIETPEDLARTVVEFRNGAPIRLGDVAQVRIGHPAPIGDAVINDGPGILLIVEKQPWGNTLDVTRGVEKVLAELKPALPGVSVDSTIFRPATFIQISIDHLTEALWLGCLLVVIILALFLGDWRTTVISLTAIPLSLAIALLLLRWRGETINTMILAGLIIALGEVVDDAIIDVENILRRLRQNESLANPLTRFQVVLRASLEVRSAVVYASVIIVLVFVPVFFLPGLAGTFFRPLALAYILAIAASLAVALTVTPALCLLLLNVKATAHRDARLSRALKVEPQTLVPHITVRLRPESAALHGLAAGRVRQAVTTLISSRKVGEVFQGQRIHDVIVWSQPHVRADFTTLRELLIETPSGGHVRLADVADLAIVPTPNAIKREGASRRIDVTCNVSGRALGDVARDVEERVGKVSFTTGYHAEILGEWAERQTAQRRLLWLGLGSLAGILVLLLADLQSPRRVLLVALTLPFALIGGVIAAWIGGGVLSLGSLVGFVTVLGIAARNGILLVSHYRHLERKEGQSFGLDLVRRGSEERLIPILMTATTAAFALLPLVLKGNVPGGAARVEATRR